MSEISIKRLVTATFYLKIKIKFSDYQNKNPRTSSKIFYNAKTKY